VTRKTSLPAECGYRFRDAECAETGAHLCVPRADRVVKFFSELLVHTKGVWARKRFVLEDWQETGIVRPLFGQVVWSDEFSRYIRRYRVAYICLARKNGKTELAAGIVLYLLVGDDEESAEVYGAAKDTKQAGKVFEPAWRMVQLSPSLSKRLKLNKHSRRIYDEKSASYYEIITSDAKGELGHNPHGFVLDEVLSQPDGSLWSAMRTASGTRAQPLAVAITTETNDPSSFGASLIDEAEKIQEDPSRAPHVFAYVRKLAQDADPWDEKNWEEPNPALGSFLSLEALRQDALEAQNEPAKENAFRQFRLNQRVQQSTRWLSLQHWDQTSNVQMIVEDQLRDRECYGALDLSSKLDLTALCWTFPDGDGFQAVWRFWLPEERLPDLDRRTAGKGSVWVRDGWLTLTEGDVIDYQAVEAQLDADARKFTVREVGFDPWGATHLVQRLDQLPWVEVRQGYRTMSEPMKEWQRYIIAGQYVHGGNPMMRWQVDNLVARQDPAGNVKPDKEKSHEKIDGCVVSIMSLGRALVAEPPMSPGIAVIDF
jgi:phage terminase large subunit-like protein